MYSSLILWWILYNCIVCEHVFNDMFNVLLSLFWIWCLHSHLTLILVKFHMCQFQPIPAPYSSELSNILSHILIKNPDERPRLAVISLVHFSLFTLPINWVSLNCCSHQKLLYNIEDDLHKCFVCVNNILSFDLL